jgi:hypothetical protein
MKKNFTYLLFMLMSVFASAQNLVVNPSFEQTASTCGNFGGEDFFNDLNGSWNNASNNALGDSCSSPDLFSACNTLFGNPTPTNMPSAVLGYQYSRTGTHHAGIITHEALSEYREYIQGRTTSPLQAGTAYCVSMYVSLGDNSSFATDNMGIYFTNSEYLRDPCPGTSSSLINVTPQLNYDCAPITDASDNWVRLEWNYVATGGEQYFTVGNFFNNANTNIANLPFNLTNPYAYYFIDDVSIIASSQCCYADVPAPQVACIDDAAFDLTATGALDVSCSNVVSGTWSGTGITNATNGTFNPATAGVGSHALSYLLSCGYTATTTVVVSGCATLSVCSEANGDLTVTGGTGPYTWNEETITEDCSNCFIAIFCEPAAPDCPILISSWTPFTNGVTISAPSDFPIQVADSDGGVLEITGVAGLPSCTGNCNLLVGLVSSTDACGGVSNGGAIVTSTGNIGTVTYSWNTSPVQTGTTLSGVEAGEYIVTATDQQGCEDAYTVVIADEVVVADAGADGIVCKGESIDLTATGGVGYVWNNSAGTGATVTVSPGVTTTYQVTITGSGGCADTDEVLITVYETPSVNFGTPNTTLCDNASPLQLAVSPLGGTVSGPGITGSVFDPAAAGVGEHIITYEYFDEPDCPGSDQITITVDLCTGVTDEQGLEGLVIHPNPSDGMFTLAYTGKLKGNVDVFVTDMSGRTVRATEQMEMSGLNHSLDMTSLTNGHYLLHINQNGSQLSVTRLTKR